MNYLKHPDAEDIRKATRTSENPDPDPIPILTRSGDKRGTAVLIERKWSRYIQDDLPFVMQEKENPVNDSTCIIWSYQRWVIEWVDHPRLAGRRDATDVYYYVRMTTRQFEDNLDVSVTTPFEWYQTTTDSEVNPVLFMQIDGVLPVGAPEEDWQNYTSVVLMEAIIENVEPIVVVHPKFNPSYRDNHYLYKWIDDFTPSIAGHWSDQIQAYVDFNEIDNYVILYSRMGDLLPKQKARSIKCGKDGLTEKRFQMLMRKFLQ